MNPQEKNCPGREEQNIPPQIPANFRRLICANPRNLRLKSLTLGNQMDRKDFIKFIALLPFTSTAMKLEDLKNITDKLPPSSKMPVLFVGHGDPMNALRDNPFTKSLHALGTEIKKVQKPSAILVVSAHWL